VFVLPSYREGFPGALLQAGAMGLPSIATDICGCNEIVVDGETGVLVPPRDPAHLYYAMKHLADDPSLRREMGARARKRVVEKFSQARVWDALMKFYDDVS
jgi:glycosyltransferase involved in cell wall biosynthesis